MRRDVKEMVVWGTVLLLSFMMIVPVPNYLYTLTEKPFLSALTHHFFHANIPHLVLNCIGLVCITGRRISLREIISIVTIGSISYAFATKPVIGLSNILFADAGLRAASYTRHQWKNPNVIVFISVMLLMVFIPQFSATTHIASFVIALLAERLFISLNKLHNDFIRYERDR